MSTVTIGDAFTALESSLNEYINDGVMSTESIAIFDLAIQNDVNFRDLLLGLPKHQDIYKCIGFISYILNFVDGKNKAPYLTIMSAYAYELGDAKEANLFVQSALTLWEDYSLAQLIKRMIMAGWSAQSLVSMRNELDPKVRERVLEELSEIIQVNA